MMTADQPVKTHHHHKHNKDKHKHKDKHKEKHKNKQPSISMEDYVPPFSKKQKISALRDQVQLREGLTVLEA